MDTQYTLDADPLMEEVYEQCSHVMHHISTTSYSSNSQIDPEHLEILMKTALLNMEKQKYRINSSQEIKEFSQIVGDLQLHSLFTENILKTPLSLYNAIVLDNIVNYINKNSNFHLDLKTLKTSRNTDIPKNHQKLYRILEKLFLLPQDKINSALERILQSIEFNILAYVFCEPTSSLYYEKCVILEDMICNRIRMPSSEEDMTFLNSIFRNVAISRKSQELFKKCLKNSIFRKSIFEFFKVALENFRARNHDGNLGEENYLDSCMETNMLYTFYLSLTSSFKDDIKEFFGEILVI